MRKRAYKSKKINSGVEKELIAKTEDCEVTVGIDIAKTEQYAAFRVDRDEVAVTLRWSHPKETTTFVELLKNLPVKKLVVALEPTGSYGDAIRHQMLNAGIDVVRVSPKESSDVKELYDGVHSAHDAKSAALIAWIHEMKPGRPWPISSDEQRTFKALEKQVRHFDGQLYQTLNKLEAAMARHWPELTVLFSLTRVTTLVLLAKYGGPQGVADNASEAIALMRQTGRMKLGQSKLREVIDSARKTTGVEPLSSEREMVKMLATDALRARESREKLKKQLEQQAEAIDEVKHMGNTVGFITAAVLFAKVGNPSEFPNAASFEKSAGLNLKEFSSGKHKGGLRITKRGSGQVRRYLFMAALRLLHNDPIAGAWYEKKVQRDGGVKLKAVVALMRKLVRALWHVAQGHEFNSSLLFDVKRLPVAV